MSSCIGVTEQTVHRFSTRKLFVIYVEGPLIIGGFLLSEVSVKFCFLGFLLG